MRSRVGVYARTVRDSLTTKRKKERESERDGEEKGEREGEKEIGRRQ